MMCGIFGILRLDNQPVQNTTLNEGAIALKHRGPDVQTTWISENKRVGFAHSRLAIIDLSEAGNQPFHLNTIEGDYSAVINGEIYNYQLLKEILIQNGFQFKGESDCEIILPLFKTQGPDFVEQLDGMFAMALWNQHQLYLARDPFGKKPLYYCYKPGQYFVFASEIKALLPFSNKVIKETSLSSYFKNGYVNSQYETIWDDIYQVKPGHYLTFDYASNELHETLYWQWPDFISPAPQEVTDSEWISGYKTRLVDAVEKRLMSDVPLGAFLSGGIDSSSVVALMHAIAPETERHTFSIYFNEKGFDTNAHIDVMVKHFGLNHHAIPFGPDDFISYFEPAIANADMLLADLSLLPMYKLASEASKDVRVVLTGDGADELLAGYDTYKATSLIRKLGPAKAALNTVLKFISPLCNGGQNKKLHCSLLMAQMQKALSHNELLLVHQAWRSIFSEEDIITYLNHALPVLDSESSWLGGFYKPGMDWLSIMQAMDIGSWMHNDILPKVDRSTMAYGLEARSPFLDRTLCEFVAQIPQKIKLKYPKWLLRKAMEGLLPQSVVWQKKSGFNMPLAKWFLQDAAMRDYVRYWLLSDQALSHGLFNKNQVEKLWLSHESQDKHLEIWNLMVFNAWHNTYANGEGWL